MTDLAGSARTARAIFDTSPTCPQITTRESAPGYVTRTTSWVRSRLVGFPYPSAYRRGGNEW